MEDDVTGKLLLSFKNNEIIIIININCDDEIHELISS